jgi:hypothetical protein
MRLIDWFTEKLMQRQSRRFGIVRHMDYLKEVCADVDRRGAKYIGKKAATAPAI